MVVKFNPIKQVPCLSRPAALPPSAPLLEKCMHSSQLKRVAILQPVSRWNKEWDYWSPNADSIWEVDEAILPLDLPVGQPHTVQVWGLLFLPCESFE